MATGNLVEIVRRNDEAFAAGDPQPMLESLAPEYRYTCHTRNRFHGTRDLPGMLALLGDAMGVQHDFRLDVVEVRLAAEGLVVAHNRVSFEVEGRRVTDADVIAVFVFEDGKIVDAVEVNSAALNRFWQAGGDARDVIR